VRLAAVAIVMALALASSMARSEDENHAARIRRVDTSSPVAASKGWSAELEHQLMSPYCPGRSLTECPSPQATELRLWIQAQEKAGVPRADVEARLFQQFGEQLRQAPLVQGWGLWAYLVPGVALLAGGAVVAGFLRRQATAAAAPRPGPAPSDPELERQIDRELGAS
jgi:cytochrome c-type biogenesis protein CcmH